MSDSFLSFSNSATFRNSLLSRNLPPYTVTGVYSSPPDSVNYETNLTVTNVVNSPDTFISDSPFSDQLYPLNKFGPEGGFNQEISYNGPPLPVDSNQGEYDPNDTVLDLVNEFFIDAAYVENRYGPDGGFQNMVTITNLQLNNRIYAPYWDPPTFVPSSYTPYTILFSNDPEGSSGLLSQDSFIAQIGGKELKKLFEARVNAEIYQNTTGALNLESLSDPFEASLIATGREPLVYRDYRITVPEFPLINAVDFATRIGSAYWPVSFIPGDYFLQNIPNFLSQQTSNALNVVNQLTGGFLGPILNVVRNPSELFIANTGNGQRSFLFNTIDYNRYQPAYRQTFGGILGVILGAVNTNGTLVGGYYVGSRNSEPSTITSPPNQLPVNAFGQQVETLVYGPSELGILYEGNSGQLNFGLQSRSLTDGGAIDGEFVWVSPKYKDNAGFKATQGGGVGSVDPEFNQISSNYQRDQSTNLDLKTGSILDQTQRLVNSADQVQGGTRLKHVGNAINQVSKVFNDGYKEMTKGSQVVKYVDNTTGGDRGVEYCRVFTKDTPYYTYADLQKRDGITTSGRRFTSSVIDNTYNLNIAPLRGEGSTNIKKNNSGQVVAKKYMFSIENLAWRTSSRPGYTYDDLPTCEKGPNGGRVMWFPPYDLVFNDTSRADWNPTNFLGRPEPIYTYKQTSRSGSISFKIVVDHPSVMNVVLDKQLKGQSRERLNSIMDSFFAGCVKFDLYTLAEKFGFIKQSDLALFQKILDDPKINREQYQNVLREIPKSNENPSTTNIQGSPDTSTNDDPRAAEFQKKYLDFGFYFDNDIPDPKTNNTTSSVPYQDTYSEYIGRKDKYEKISKNTFESSSENYNVKDFFENVVEPNYKIFTDGFIKDAYEILNNGGTITISMLGSASSPAEESYNLNLSKRRIDSVKQFFETYTIGDINLKKFIDDKKFTISNVTATGETATNVNPKTADGNFGLSVNCTEKIKDKTGKVTSNSEIYAVNAMACRRVVINNIVAKLEEKKEQQPTPELKDPLVEKKEQIKNQTKPQPKPSTIEDVKKGISKKVLRQMLSECDYFEVIKEQNPMIYDSIREKIKFFNPAFHSITPEGLNSRLTFLNQCVRPGETIPIIGTDGRPKSNDAINTSFGAPPVCILRIGDFYHTKIIPRDLSFTYDPLLYDMNPEGIGLQPMIAKVTLGFDIIGGMGLEKPIEQLQNALSFNFYANTEMYDERATPTEDTSKLDKQIIDALTDGEKPGPKVNNQQENKGGTTIGTIITNTPVTGGQTGETSYQKVMDTLLTQTKEYFINLTNQLEKFQINKENGNYGLLQLMNSKKVEGTTDWEIKGTFDKMILFGKPDYQPLIDSLFNLAIDDLLFNQNIIILDLEKENFTDQNILELINVNIQKYLTEYKQTYSNNVATIVQEIVNYQIEFVQTTRCINLVNNLETDGLLLSGNVPRVYSVTGIELTGTDSDSGYNTSNEQLNGDYIKLPDVVEEYRNFLNNNEIIYLDPESGYADDTFIQTNAPFESLQTIADKRFYMIMARVLTDKSRRESFTNAVLTQNIITLDQTKKIKKKFNKVLDNIQKDYEKNIKFYDKKFEKLRKQPTYLELTDGIENKLYKLGKPRKFTYTTVPGPNDATQKEEIKNLYLNVPKFQ